MTAETEVSKAVHLSPSAKSHFDRLCFALDRGPQIVYRIFTINLNAQFLQ
jgi:hypothetical protein